MVLPFHAYISKNYELQLNKQNAQVINAWCLTLHPHHPIWNLESFLSQYTTKQVTFSGGNYTFRRIFRPEITLSASHFFYIFLISLTYLIKLIIEINFPADKSASNLITLYKIN